MSWEYLIDYTVEGFSWVRWGIWNALWIALWWYTGLMLELHDGEEYA